MDELYIWPPHHHCLYQLFEYAREQGHAVNINVRPNAVTPTPQGPNATASVTFGPISATRVGVDVISAIGCAATAVLSMVELARAQRPPSRPLSPLWPAEDEVAPVYPVGHPLSRLEYD